MNTLSLIGMIIGSAAFGALLGKLLDAFLLSPKNAELDRKRWLRENKLEAFTQIIEEMLSLGLKKGFHNDPWKFKSLAAKAILLFGRVTVLVNL